MTLHDFIFSAGDLVSEAFGVLVGAGLLVFLWGLSKFIWNMGSEGKVEEGRNIMTWGLIALFVMVSVWGIIQLLQSNLGLTGLDL